MSKPQQIAPMAASADEPRPTNGAIRKTGEMSSSSFRAPLCFHGGRFLMMALALLCMTAISANSLLLNFTVICMRSDANFTSGQQGLLLAGTAVGGILAIGPVPPLISLLGLRSVFAFVGLLSAVSTALMPLLFSLAGFWALMAVRVIQGACLMPAMPAISQVTHHWANSARREQPLFIMVLSLYMQLGIILTMPVAGWLCSSAWGWPAAYHLFGLLSFLLFLAFALFYRNSPQQSPFISEAEADALWLAAANQQQQHAGTDEEEATTNDDKQRGVPFWPMLTDGAVWACLSSAVGYGMAYWLFAQEGPTYMHEVLDYEVESAGIWVAVPYFFAIFSKLVVVLLERTALPLRVRIVWLPFGCQLLDVACFVLLGLWPASSPVLAQAAVIAVLSANGAGFVALASNCQVIARQHAHFILSLFALINYVITLVQPLIIAWAAASEISAELAGQWSRIFFIYGALLFLLNILFTVGARTQPRPWTGHKLGTNNHSPWALGRKGESAASTGTGQKSIMDRF